MRLAAIDIGTNSTRLLISELLNMAGNELKFFPVTREMKITRLGRDLGVTGMISPEGAQRTVTVLDSYLELIRNHDVKKYRAVGTKVLRVASNSRWFTDHVEKLTGLKVEVISSRMEALLSFHGAARTLTAETVDGTFGLLKEAPGNSRKQNILVLDIGGGSTEFVTGNLSGEISLIESAEIGSVSISEMFLDSRIPDIHSISRMNDFIEKKLAGILKKVISAGFSRMIGLAGTVSSLASVDMGLEKYEMERINGHLLKIENIKRIHEKFCSVNTEERKRIKGLDPERADIIIGGTAILVKIMECFQVEELTVSENDILDGIIYSLI